MPTLGVTELAIIGVIVALLFGGSKLPGIGRGLGGMISEFRDSVKGGSDDEDKAAEKPKTEEKPAEDPPA